MNSFSSLSQNGEIWFESEIGIGSKFHFTIQVQDARERKNVTKKSLISREKRILITHHCTDLNRKFIENCLKEIGIEAIFEINGDVDGMIVDFEGMMDEKELRESKIPLIILCSQRRRMELKKTFGDVIILTKPLKKSCLIVGIEGLFSKQKKNMEEKNEAKKEEEKKNQTGKRILVVEDNVLNCKILCKILESNQMNCFPVFDGQEAVNEFKKNSEKYDLVILDINLPEKNGFEVCKDIREFERNSSSNRRNCVIIALTASGEELRKDCLNAGMNDMCTKPFKKEDILKKIEEWRMTGQ